MKKTVKALLVFAITVLFAILLCSCNFRYSGDNDPPDGAPTEDKTIECDGYTLTVNGTVLKNLEFTVRGAAVRVVVPEGITEITHGAGRMLLNAVSITIPSTLEKFNYTNHVDLFSMYWSHSRVFEIYDLSKHFDFDLENANYSSRLTKNLKVIHTSAKEESVLTEKDGFIYYLTETEAVLAGFTALSDTLTVPAYYEGIPVTLAPYAFSETQSGKVILSEGITAVSDHCFSKTGFTEITLPDTVKTIGESAFTYCYNLVSITVPEGVESIEAYTFSNCSRLTDVTLPDTVNAIDKCAFNSCSKLTALTFPDSLEYLDCSAIYDTSLTSIHLPKSLRQLIIPEPYDLYGITEFTTHPENVYFSAENGVLFSKNRKKLIRYPAGKTETSYTVPEGVQEISDLAFYRATNLTSVTVSEGVEAIGEDAFRGCKNLQALAFPKTLISLTVSAFDGLNQLTSITVHPENPAFTTVDGVLFNKKITELMLYPQNKTDSAYTVPDTVKTVCTHAFDGVKFLKKITLPEGLTTIESYAFYKCDYSPLMITFPHSLAYIGKAAFYGCDLVLTWEYSGDWTATNGKNETVTLSSKDFEDIREIKFKLLQESADHTLTKNKT